MSRRKPNSPPPEKRYRIVEIAGEYYPQYRQWFLWRYFETPAPYPANTTFSVGAILLKVSYPTRAEAASHIRNTILENLSTKKNKAKQLPKVICYFDDTGYEF